MKMYDVIIIGAGPAGLISAVYSARYELDVLVIGKIVGGLAVEAPEVYNFPSYKKLKGFELMKKITEQAKELNVEIKQKEVLEIKKKGLFEVVTSKDKYFSKKIILATGSERKRLGIEKERKFIGKGINYCAICDAGFYKNKIVGVAGGGDSALSSALLLAKFAKQVYIIYRRDKFYKAKPDWIKQVEKNKKIVCIFSSIIEKLEGENKLEGVKLNSKGGKKNLKLDGLFIEIGSSPNSKLAEKLKVKLNEGYISVDKKQKTNVSGVFAAGDVTDNSLKQIITACSEGAVAANSVYEELVND